MNNNNPAESREEISVLNVEFLNELNYWVAECDLAALQFDAGNFDFEIHISSCPRCVHITKFMHSVAQAFRKLCKSLNFEMPSVHFN